MRLPEDWNGKLFTRGCGGFCGYSGIAWTNDALMRGYAILFTDMGTTASSAIKGDWAYENQEREFNFGFRATHSATVVAKKIIQTYFDSPAEYAYWMGCSTGGRHTRTVEDSKRIAKSIAKDIIRGNIYHLN